MEHVGRSVVPGDVVADKYRVERVIGQGGMGIVLAALDTKLGRRVALKFLLPHLVAHPASVARFEREARASVALESDHVCRVYEVGRMPNGTPFIAMELLEGIDLAHELARRRTGLPITEAVSYVLQACNAISEAHARGIIHRDLKPANLFLSKREAREPIVKVLDFGISKPTGIANAPTALTGTSDFLGSPLYMSPEQLRAPKTVDARSDVWSLAAALYELVSGRPPFDSNSLADLSMKITSAPAPDLRQRVPNAPPGFPEVIGRALEKSPDARFQSIDEFARALAPYATPTKTVALAPSSSTRLLAPSPHESNRTLPIAAAPSLVPAAVPRSDPSLVEPAPSPPVHSFAVPLALGGVVLAFVIVAAVLVIRDPSPRVETADASATASADSPAPTSADASPASTSDAALDPSPIPDPVVSPPVPVQSVPPPVVVPRPPASAAPDARVFESAGY